MTFDALKPIILAVKEADLADVPLDLEALANDLDTPLKSSGPGLNGCSSGVSSTPAKTKSRAPSPPHTSTWSWAGECPKTF